MTRDHLKLLDLPEEARIGPLLPRFDVGSAAEPSNSSADQGTAERGQSYGGADYRLRPVASR